MSKGQKMAQVITRKLKIGDKFTLPGNRFETYEVVNIKDDYLIFRNIKSNEEFQMVRGFAQKVDLVDESADYQKKRFKEPYYMYNESKKVVENKMVGIISLPVGSKFIDDSFGGKRTLEVVKHGDDDVVHVKEVGTGRKFAYDASTPGGNKKVEKIEEGFMVKEKSGNTYIGRFDSKDKADKAVKDLAKKYGKSEGNWLVEPDDKYMAAATAKGASSWGPIPMNTLVESFIIQDSDSNDKPVYFHYGKYTGYDWGFDKKAATKFSTKEAAERMIEQMRQEGMLINSMKVVSEAFKRNYNFNSGDKLILNTDFGDPTIKSKADHDPRFNETVIFSKRLDNLNAIVKNTKNSGHMNNSNPDVGEKVPLNILMTAPEYEQWKKTLESRIAKGYENLNAEEKARHLLSHPSSKYMSDLKSENITERAIRKAVKEMLGKQDKRDPQFITDVNEEGEAPAIANTTAEVANPELPLKLKESVGQKLNITLVRKPQNMKEVESDIRKGYGDRVKAVVDKSYKLSADEYDKFVYNFMVHTTYLSGEGGVDPDGTVHVVEISAPGKKTIYVDPEGYDYARYVGY